MNDWSNAARGIRNPVAEWVCRLIGHLVVWPYRPDVFGRLLNRAPHLSLRCMCGAWYGSTRVFTYVRWVKPARPSRRILAAMDDEA